MKIYVVQHGDAVAKSIDPERPLSARGRSDIQRMAQFLTRLDRSALDIYHSGKTRARETAEILADSLAVSVAGETLPGLAPNDPIEPIAHQVENWSRDTLLVGHMPFVGRLVSYLVIGNTEQQITAFRPGSLACLEWDEDRGWAVAWMIRPELLNEAAPA